MGQSPAKNMRKLVTFTPDLADRVELYRKKTGASSETEAIKALIEDGLKLQDTPIDLFRRCQMATIRGQSIGDIISLIATDHPLVESTILDRKLLTITLIKPSPLEGVKFELIRERQIWEWYDWADVFSEWQVKAVPPHRTGMSASATSDDLDEEIPF